MTIPNVALALVVLGPGALAPADDLVLERVMVSRVLNGWGLDHLQMSTEVVLVAVEDCAYLGSYGTIETGDGMVRACYVVDCQGEGEATLSELGLVADISPVVKGLGHKQATITLYGRPQ